MLKHLFIEIKRIVASRKIVITLIIFLSLSIFLVYSDLDEYKKILKYKADFIYYEKLKTSQYISYEIYGAYGFQIFYMPSNINIFFSKGPITTRSYINIKETVDVNSSLKGSYTYTSTGFFNSLSSFLLFFGSLLSLIYGADTFKSRINIFFYRELKYAMKTIFSRIILMLLYFCIIFSSTLITAIIREIGFLNSEINIYFMFIFYSLFIFTFFFLTGLIISLITINKKNIKFEIAILFWLILTILSTLVMDKIILNKFEKIQSNDKLNILKLKTAMNFEQKAIEKISKMKRNLKSEELLALSRKLLSEYLKEGQKRNIEMENSLMNETKDVILFYEKVSLIMPTTYYCYLNNELSNKSYQNYLQFFKYIMKLRDEFMDFYINKRYYTDNQFEVESFVKNDENIFKAKPELPKSFKYGLLLLLCYVIILCVLIHKRIKYLLEKKHFLKKTGEVAGGNTALKEINNEDINFIKARTKAERDELFDFIKSKKENSVFLDRVSKDDFFNIKLKYLYDLYRSLNKVDEEKFLKYLEIFTINKKILEKKISEIENADFKRFYASMVLANDKFIVVNDYLEGEDLELRMNFTNLIEEINLKEKRGGVYIGFRLYKAISPEELKVEDSDSENFQKYLTININERTNNFERKLIF